jgi:ankyrin repeat protein
MKPESPDAQSIFGEALRLKTPAECAAYLDQVCAGNPGLRQEVESLLSAYDKAQAGDFLGQTRQLSALDLLSEATGTMVGRYKLLEQIGEGGFGVVWMAEQEEPVRRRVALKIIKLGMDTKEVVARFEAERQALAMMDHPNIASVFDGGATDTGRPYFVMELVKGIPITRYCDANKLSTRERLELFMQVCHAVQHAHQKGVIHRDLKPSNVLVTVKDDRPGPKVIDFGIAKATQARLTQKTLFTRFQQWIGTPAYMSPEQAGLGSLDVDTRSDVYSLGVLLYELLIGRTPFDTEKLLAAGYDAVMRTIREEEPPKPSTRLSALKVEELTAVATKRHADPAKLSRLVRGDLDWIVMKALEKDRTRRYETARDFEQDIHRHLVAEPVSAAAPGTMYLAGKFLRRNGRRLVFGTVAVVALALALIAVKLARDLASAQQDFVSKGTNTVFTFARADDVKNLRRLLGGNPRLVIQRDAEGATPLECAAIAGSTNALRLLLSRGADVNATNNLGWTPLLGAAVRGRASAVAALLEAGANPNHAAKQGETALVVASLVGDVEVGRLLLAKGALVEAAFLPTRTTALQQAARLGHAAFVELLLDHGARTDFKDANGNAALHEAGSGLRLADVFRAWRGQLDQLTAHKPDDQSLSAAVAVAVSNQMAQTQPILPADLLRAGGEHRRVAELLLAKKADLEVTDNAGCTPLWIAAAATNCPVAQVLIAHKANLNARSRNGFTPVSAAARKGGVPMASLLLAAGADPNLADSAGFTPLNTAVEQGHLGVVRVLLAHQANPNLACPNGQTPLHTAAGRGDLDSMRLLLARGAALHPLTPSGTPLAWAVQQREREAVKFLLQQDAKPDVAPPQSGLTALHWAAWLGHPDLAQSLLDAGGSVDAASSWWGTPLNVAAAGRHGAQKWLAVSDVQTPQDAKPAHPSLGSDEDYLGVLRTLLAAKANVNAREPRFERTPIFMAVSEGNPAALDLLLAAGTDVQMVDRFGLTALHAASEMEAPALVVSNIVARLLKAGISPDARDRFRATPLHAAANANKPMMAELLLAAGARINAVGPELRTPLLIAVGRGYSDIVRLLLAKRADLEWRDAVGTTALHQAVQLHAKDIATLLLDHGADVNVGTTNGSTALMIAAQNGDLAMLKSLLERGADINAVNQSGITALMSAAGGGHMDSARLLLEQGAKLHQADRDGNTPLICAATAGSLEMVRFLLDQGAKIDIQNMAGLTAIHQAADHGHAEVVEFLLDRGVEVNTRRGEQAKALELLANPGMKANPRSDNYTPLHFAANGFFTNEVHYVAVVRVLLAHGADVNARTRENQTPLHRAAYWGHPEIIRVLLAARADLSIRDDDGKTALDLATATEESRLRPGVAAGRRECAALLRANNQVQTPDAKVQMSNQSTSLPAGEPKP